MDDDTNTCTPGTSTISFSAPFSSDQGTDYEIIIIVATGTNQDSVRDAGTIQIDVYSKDDNGDSQLKDQYSGDSGFIATAGAIVKDSNVVATGGVTAVPSSTYYSGAVYTFFMETDHDVSASGFIIITLPTADMGTSGSGTNSNCLFEGANPEDCTVDDDAGTVTIELKSTQSITGGTAVEVAFGGIRNPRTFETSDYITIVTQDADGNSIDSGAT
jgi:hypothetical protein